MNDKEDSTLENTQIVLIEKAKLIRHQLNACRAAFRLLEGAVLTGIVEAKAANQIVPNIIKYEEKLLKSDFADDFFALASKPLFKKSVSKKYEAIKSKFPRLDKKKILIVDDKYAETGWKQVFSLLFGENSITGSNSDKATMKYLEKNSLSVAFILMDLKLPKEEKQGIKLIGDICKSYPEIPIIAFSVSDSIIFARQAFQAGAWDFFPKEPEDASNRNPIDYFLTFYGITKHVLDYNKNYVETFWKNIMELENYLSQFDSQQGAGMAKATAREFKKAYKHLVYEEMNKFTPSFLEMSQYDEVIYCCAKAFETYLRLYTVSSGIHTETRRILKNLEKELTLEEVNVLKSLRGLGEIINVIQRESAKLGISEDWFNSANKIIKRRNRYIHGYLGGSSYKSSRMRPANRESAISFLQETLSLIAVLREKSKA